MYHSLSRYELEGLDTFSQSPSSSLAHDFGRSLAMSKLWRRVQMLVQERLAHSMHVLQLIAAASTSLSLTIPRESCHIPPKTATECLKCPAPKFCRRRHKPIITSCHPFVARLKKYVYRHLRCAEFDCEGKKGLHAIESPACKHER